MKAADPRRLATAEEMALMFASKGRNLDAAIAAQRQVIARLPVLSGERQALELVLRAIEDTRSLLMELQSRAAA
jgi:hypothetical protein